MKGVKISTPAFKVLADPLGLINSTTNKKYNV